MNTYLTDEIFMPLIKQQYRLQLHDMVQMDRAYGMMLVKQNLLDKRDYQCIDTGLCAVDASFSEEELKAGRIDLYLNMTDKLYEYIGEEKGCLLHVGRSRNDMCTTCNRMQVRRSIWQIAGLVNDVMESLLCAAEKNVDSILTYYTYGQPAQPGTFAHYLMVVFELLARDFRRITAAYGNTNRCPMGAAAGMGTSYQLDRKYISDLLGFDSVIENTLDAVSNPDFLLEIQSALAIMAANISRVAQDFIFWSSDENRVLDFSLDVATGSSIMPQKKNPVTLEHMRARTAAAIGLLNTSLSLCRSASLFPNIDGYSYIYYNYAEALPEVLKSLQLLKLTLENCEVRRENAYERTKGNLSGATAISEYLSQKHHIPFTKVHHVVKGMVTRLMENGSMDCGKLTGRLMAEISEKTLGVSLAMSDEEVQRLLDPSFALNYRTNGGTPKPEDVSAMISSGREVLASQKSWLASAEKQVADAYAEIDDGLKE